MPYINEYGKRANKRLRISISISVDANGVRFDEMNDTIQFIKKLHSLAVDLFIEPGDSFINFLLSECEESDVHERLYLLINSSYDTV